MSVEDTLVQAEGRPTTAGEYVQKVAALMTHTVYHYPGSDLQVTTYLEWLLGVAHRHPFRELQAADSRARQAMALRPRDYLTAVDLDRFVSPTPSRQINARLLYSYYVSGNNYQTRVCLRHVERNACRYPCPAGRYHPHCVSCGPQGHPTRFHPGASHGRPTVPLPFLGRGPRFR